MNVVAFENWPEWFRQMWPGQAQRQAVLNQYRAIGQQFPKALADIALRAGLFAPALGIKNEFEAGVAEGQRRCALQLYKLCNANIDDIYRQTLDNGSERKS